MALQHVAAAGPCNASKARSSSGVSVGDARQAFGDIGEVAFLGPGIDDEMKCALATGERART